MEKLLVGACLLGENCKYSGGSNALPKEQLRALAAGWELVPVCPEVAGGLSTPRTPSERRGEAVVTRDGRDVTAAFRAGARLALETARREGCCRALLKQRSPSCGVGTVYDGSFTGTLRKGDGVAAALLREAGLELYSEEEIEKLI